MTTLKYAHLSPGYLGIKSPDLTLNSSYFAKILQQPLRDYEEYLEFPQRIPKVGFFKELCDLEENSFQSKFESVKLMSQAGLSNIKYISSDYYIINSLNFLLRYGCCNAVVKSSFDDYEFSCSTRSVEFRYLIANAEIEVSLSSKQEVDIKKLESLVNQILNDRLEIDERLTMRILNRFIVVSCRLKVKLKDNSLIAKVTAVLKKLIDRFECENNYDLIRLSYIYRGIPMSPVFDQKQKSEFLLQSGEMARDVTPKNEIEKILSEENYYTLLQTMSKWYSHLGKLDKAVESLEEMMIIDPFDVTAYTEFGFLLFKQEKYQQAADMFYKGCELGPPGVGMNLYFYAVCFQKQGVEKKALDNFYKNTEIDPAAISPWLAIYDIEKANGNAKKAKKIAAHLLGSEILRKQLSEDETEEFNRIID